jgi:hypothetical protein
MSKIKFNKRRKVHSYTQINNSVAENTLLSWKAKGLLLYMMSRPDGWEMNKTDLVKRATDKETSVDTGLKELKENRYLYIRKYRNEKGHFEGWEWIYDDEPFELETPEPAPAKDLSRNLENPPIGSISQSPKPRKSRNRENPEIGKIGVYNNKELLNKKDYLTKRIDDDDKGKRVSPVTLTLEQINEIHSRLRNEYSDMKTVSFQSVCNNVRKTHDAGKIAIDYEGYLRGALNKRMDELEANREKRAQQPKQVYTRGNRSNGRKEIVPDWQQEAAAKAAAAEEAKKEALQPIDLEAERAELEKEFAIKYKK